LEATQADSPGVTARAVRGKAMHKNAPSTIPNNGTKE
jgi:hypothetical protein